MEAKNTEIIMSESEMTRYLIYKKFIDLGGNPEDLLKFGPLYLSEKLEIIRTILYKLLNYSDNETLLKVRDDTPQRDYHFKQLPTKNSERPYWFFAIFGR